MREWEHSWARGATFLIAAAPFAELLIDCEEDRTLRAVLVGHVAGRRPLELEPVPRDERLQDRDISHRGLVLLVGGTRTAISFGWCQPSRRRQREQAEREQVAIG